MNLQSVKQLRQTLSCLKTVPGTYRWWFDEKTAGVLLHPLGLTPKDPCLLHREINGQRCTALYYGASVNVRERLKWHIQQKHTESAVLRGTLSTLRQMFAALLQTCPLQAECQINNLIDNGAYVEWEYGNSAEDVELLVLNELSAVAHYYPLNQQNNPALPRTVKQRMNRLRKTNKETLQKFITS